MMNAVQMRMLCVIPMNPSSVEGCRNTEWDADVCDPVKDKVSSTDEDAGLRCC